MSSGRRLCLLLGLLSASPAVLADAAGFDALIRQYESGERVFYSREDALAYLKELEQALPAADAKRQRRLERERCPVSYSDDPATGVQFASTQIEHTENTDSENLAYFYLCRAGYHFTAGDQSLQQRDLEQAYALAQKSENPQAIADALSAQADDFSTRGEHAEALVRLFRANELYQKTNNQFALGYSLENIAAAFRRMGEYDKALEYLEQSEREFVKPGDVYREAFIAQQRTFIYAEMGKPHLARQQNDHVLALYQNEGERHIAVGVLIDRLWISNLEQKYAESMQLVEQIEQEIATLRRGQPDYRPYNDSLYQLYRAEALTQYGQLAAGLAAFEQAYASLEKSQNPRYALMLFRSWSAAQATAGNFERAYQLQQQMIALQEQMNSQSKQQREALLRFQFDSERQQARNEQLLQQNQLSSRQLAMLEQAQRWQYIALGLFILLALAALAYAISQISRNRRLQKLAMTDELTQVGNRRSILAFCELTRLQCRQSEQTWCLLILDLDNFKQCNDNYGHDAGDLVLVAAANAMQSVLRHGDKVGRSGGEEFLLVLPDTREQQAAEVAERLRYCIAQLSFASCPDLAVSASIGVTQAGRLEEVHEVITRADRALYQAKANGRDQVVIA